MAERADRDAPRGPAAAVMGALRVLLPVLFFLYVFGVALKYPLNDPDVWWHLKTGQYVVQHWEVPDADPFAYTTPVPLDEGKKIGMRAHWLGQVLLYLSSVAGGLMGVGVYRSLLVALPMLATFLWLLRRGLGSLPSLGVVAFPALMLSADLFYAFERPQGVSFTLALAAVMLLEAARRGWRRSEGRPAGALPWVLPLVMAFWANVHAGFIIGNAVIILYLASEGAKAAYFALRGRGREGLHPLFFVLGAASVAASFANPNTYHIFYSYMAGLMATFFTTLAQTARGDTGWVAEVVLEYKPLVYFYRELGFRWVMFYWAFTALAYAVLAAKYILRKRVDVTELLVVSFFTLFANYYARGLMFALAVVPLFVGRSLAEMSVPGGRSRLAYKAAFSALLVVTLGFASFTYSTSPLVLRAGVSRYWITPWYPMRMVEFIRSTDLRGPMYNFYTWGGFLIWSLYPDYKVFIDGRALDNNVAATADGILKTYPGWESRLEAFDINFIAVPVVYRESGHIVPLATALVGRDDWKLVFLDQNSALFVKDAPENAEVIARHQMDKKLVFVEIVKVENVLLSGMPRHPAYNLAKAIYERFPSMAARELETLRRMGY